MIDDITSAITGIFTALTSMLSTGTGTTEAGARAYVAILALPVLGGTVALARRLIKKAR